MRSVRGSQTLQRTADNASEFGEVLIDFNAPARGCFREVRMCSGVRSYPVSSSDLRLNQIGSPHRFVPNIEKRCWHSVSGKYRQHLRSPRWVRSIIEGQRDDALPRGRIGPWSIPRA